MESFGINSKRDDRRRFIKTFGAQDFTYSFAACIGRGNSFKSTLLEPVKGWRITVQDVLVCLHYNGCSRSKPFTQRQHLRTGNAVGLMTEIYEVWFIPSECFDDWSRIVSKQLNVFRKISPGRGNGK